MQRNVVYVGLCLVAAVGFFTLAYCSGSVKSESLSDNPPVTVEGPVKDGVLNYSSAASDSSRPSGHAPYSLEEKDRVPIPDGSVDDVVRELLPRAKAGEARAALALYRKMAQCDAVVHNEANAQEIAIYKAMGAGVQYEAIAAKAQDSCITDGSADFSTRGEWLELAAAQGSLEAKLIYATDIDAFFPSPSDMIRDPKGLEEYKRRSVNYMAGLASSGNIDSMMWLARAYEDGIMLDRNFVNSYAYYKAVDLIVPGTMPEGMLSSAREMISVDERKRAENLAVSIKQACCSGG